MPVHLIESTPSEPPISPKQRTSNQQFHPRKPFLELTVHLWKKARPQKEINLPTIDFQVRAASFTEGRSQSNHTMTGHSSIEPRR